MELPAGGEKKKIKGPEGAKGGEGRITGSLGWGNESSQPYHSVALACAPVALKLALSDSDALPLALALALSDGLSAGDPLHETPGEKDAEAVVERLGVPAGEAESV